MAKSKWEQVKDKLILIEGWARDGFTNKEIAVKLGIGETTFYKIVNEHPEVSEVLKKGKEVIDYQVENALLKNALDGNTTAQIYWLNNRRPDRWKNKRNEEENNTIQSLAEIVQKAYESKAGGKQC